MNRRLIAASSKASVTSTVSDQSRGRALDVQGIRREYGTRLADGPTCERVEDGSSLKSSPRRRRGMCLRPSLRHYESSQAVLSGRQRLLAKISTTRPPHLVLTPSS